MESNIDRVEPLAGGRGQFFVNGYRIYKNPNESCWHVERLACDEVRREGDRHACA